MARGTGKLRDRVAFDSPTESPDGSGGVETGWHHAFTRPGEFIYQRGSEAVDAARAQGRAAYKLRVRSSAKTREITTAWRVRDVLRQEFNDQGDCVAGVYNIREVDTVTDRAWVYLVIESGVAI